MKNKNSNDNNRIPTLKTHRLFPTQPATILQKLTDNQRSLPNEIVTLLKNTNAI